MAKAKKEKIEEVEVDPNTPLNEVLAELLAGIPGGTDVAQRQATYDKLKAWSDSFDED